MNIESLEKALQAEYALLTKEHFNAHRDHIAGRTREAHVAELFGQKIGIGLALRLLREVDCDE
ncbi:hypothetical protein [Mycobacteroides abscessus]|uniref:hypothetical protein n=1 Tax=Mycobacteroides abscessus TaxID=36809 RepID=UPI0011A12549|nr:hypothetical protein [Mycobacteroides abscessus]